MKRIILSIALVLSFLGLQAQSRKHIANFSLFQQYFNPALTGFEGSMLKTYYRDQWAGYEGAPSTVFASAELDLADVKAWRNSDVLKTSEEDAYDRQAGASNALGLALLSDRFGPFSETQLHLSYGTRVRLSDRLALRWGAAATLNLNRLNGNKLTVDQAGDPMYQDYLGASTRSGRADINLGLMLTAEDYYLGYAMQDVTKGKLVLSGDDYLNNTYARQHVVQAGYRTALSEQLGLVANGIYRYDEFLRGTVEGQLKAVFANTFWAGAGYRHDLAYSFHAGVRLHQLKVGYVHESPTGEANYIGKGTNEIMLTFNLIPVKYPKYSRNVTMW